jgi:hypothetical protein
MFCDNTETFIVAITYTSGSREYFKTAADKTFEITFNSELSIAC